MDFNHTGYLDAGFHVATEQQIKENLVDPHPSTSSRHSIFAGYCKHKLRLEAIPVTFEQWFDGSFVSKKENPSDIDLLCLAHRVNLAKLTPDQQKEIQALFTGKGTLKDFCCDTYFLPVVDETDPGFPHYRQLRKYWLGEFGFDRQDIPKGILRVSINPPPPTPPATPSPPAVP